MGKAITHYIRVTKTKDQKKIEFNGGIEESRNIVAKKYLRKYKDFPFIGYYKVLFTGDIETSKCKKIDTYTYNKEILEENEKNF